MEPPLVVVLQIVVPRKEILGEGVEVERVRVLAVNAFSGFLELHAQPCFACTVVSVEHYEVLPPADQVVSQARGQFTHVRKAMNLWLAAHASAFAIEGNNCSISPLLWVLRPSSF